MCIVQGIFCSNVGIFFKKKNVFIPLGEFFYCSSSIFLLELSKSIILWTGKFMCQQCQHIKKYHINSHTLCCKTRCIVSRFMDYLNWNWKWVNLCRQFCGKFNAYSKNNSVTCMLLKDSLWPMYFCNIK